MLNRVASTIARLIVVGIALAQTNIAMGASPIVLEVNLSEPGLLEDFVLNKLEEAGFLEVAMATDKSRSRGKDVHAPGSDEFTAYVAEEGSRACVAVAAIENANAPDPCSDDASVGAVAACDVGASLPTRSWRRLQATAMKMSPHYPITMMASTPTTCP